MGDSNSMNEGAIDMGDSIGEELDYEASDNIEHEDDAQETIEHERIVKEVSNSDGDRINNSSNSAEKVAESCEKVEDPKPIGDSEVKDHVTKEETQSNTKNQDNKKVANEKPSVGSTASKSVCKPCNLVFENSRWLEKHNESGDHTHVIKGFNPGGGKYYCYLCWLGFEHSEMLLHHIKRSEHITRARRRGVSDVSIKPVSSKASHSSSQTYKHSERVPHRSCSQSKKPSSQTHKSVSQSHKSSTLSHRHTSSSSHRSRSPLRIRLSDYYEVSSVGHCDTSGVRLKSLANGIHKSSKDSAVKSVEGKCIQKADLISKPREVTNNQELKEDVTNNQELKEDVTNNQESKEEVDNNLDSVEKIEASTRILCTENGSIDPEAKSLNVAHNKHDLSDVLDTKPPDECNDGVETKVEQVVSVNELSGEPANSEMES